MANLCPWLRIYGAPVKVYQQTEYATGFGMLWRDYQDDRYTEYPQPTPAGVRRFDRRLVLFSLDSPSFSQPDRLDFSQASYRLTNVQFIPLLNCWRAIAKEAEH